MTSRAALLLCLLLAGCVSQPTRAPNSSAEGIFFDFSDSYLRGPRAAPRPISTAAINLTKSMEAFRASPYNDPAHYCTIAFGHLLGRHPCALSDLALFPNPITEPTGVQILRIDMHMAELVVSRRVTVDLDDYQYGALCDFVYNVGATNFTHSSLLTVINRHELSRVGFELQRWILAGRQPQKGLVRRRQLEIAMFYTETPMARTNAHPPAQKQLIDVITGECHSQC